VMQKNPELKMQVDGHTCNLGLTAYNLKLSEKRAKAVKNYLVGKGINKGAISTKGYGASKPTASNDTRQGRVLNRRAVLEPSAR
jgi:OOP family OmpA-OmpF porin